MYFPVLINEADSGYPLILQLRAGNSHSGKGVAGILRWLFWRLKRAWPTVKIILRGDAGFSLPEIIRLCERSGVGYAFGFSSNAVLKRKISYLLDQSRLQYLRTQEKARLFDDVYYAARSWSEPRRVVMKAEWLEKGANPRFVVTNLFTDAQELYDDFYVQRGTSSEHRIKELKLGIKADRRLLSEIHRQSISSVFIPSSLSSYASDSASGTGYQTGSSSGDSFKRNSHQDGG